MPEEHHDHLIDIKNGKVIEFQNDAIEELQKKIAKELGYKLVDHRLELYGIPVKRKNKTVKYKFDGNNRKLEKFRSLSTVKYVAKNVIYLKGWSNEKLPKKNSYKFKNNINFKFKNYLVKVVREPDPLVLKSKELRFKSFLSLIHIK